MHLRKLILILLLCLFSLPLLARELAGVVLPQQVQPAGMQQTLQLNGAGIRKKFFVKVYVAALYLPQPTRDAAALLQSPPPNRMLMHMRYPFDNSKARFMWRTQTKGEAVVAALAN